MRISARAVYASMAVLDLAMRSNEKPIQAKEIAARQGIPFKFLEQILVRLKNAGIAESTRGAAGGYRIKQPPDSITLREVIEAVDGELNIVDIEIPDPFLTDVWKEIQEKLLAVLDDVTIGDLVEWKQKAGGTWIYQI